MSHWRPDTLAGYESTEIALPDAARAAGEPIAADHGGLVVLGHSTGGLIAALWAARYPDRVSALILNSPWLDVQRAATFLRVGTRMTTRAPTSPIPLPDLGISVRNMHRSYGGEWDYDLNLKTTPHRPYGWAGCGPSGSARPGSPRDCT